MNAPTRIFTVPEKARLRVEDFLLLDESGAFSDYTKTELLDGEIYAVNAQHSRHARTKSRLLVEFARALEEMGSEFEPLAEPSTRISDHSLPEPDIVLTSYRGEGVVPLDSVALIVEVSDTTLDSDLGRKSDLYAAAGVREYWVIDLTENRALLHEEPSVDGYLGQADVLLGETLHSATIEGLAVDTRNLLN